MKPSIARLFAACFPQLALFAYVKEMRDQLADCRSCLDIGCGEDSPVRLLSFDYTVGLEGHSPTLENAKARRTHNELQFGRVQDLGKMFRPRQFDCVVALDVIEHLSKEDGHQLLLDMERIAAKKVLLFTPNGFLPQRGHKGDLQEHLSGWEPLEMRVRGYRVLGMQGPKFLRGEYHEHRFHPRALSGVLSVLGHYFYTRARPEAAAALLCVKSVQ
jgi:hypothetical protein